MVSRRQYCLLAQVLGQRMGVQPRNLHNEVSVLTSGEVTADGSKVERRDSEDKAFEWSVFYSTTEGETSA